MSVYVDKDNGYIRLMMVPIIGNSEIPMRRLIKFSDDLYDIANKHYCKGIDSNLFIENNISNDIDNILKGYYDLDTWKIDLSNMCIKIKPFNRREIQYKIEVKT